ncbi:WG repeat-containing protein [Chryseobacterium sp.]|uniref:WG repeat-containing protein n=1 Tax=Chryseobacterium sp. TaxID=1871047 RepID=UPI00289771D9|nr:WG repeat-containing protein [Chryseobacterium sp.]
MKTNFQIFFILISIFCFSQEDRNWYVFYNSDSTKFGYKDSQGNIKIEPKFESFSSEPVFKKVVAVVERINEKDTQEYYLNKAGKKFGIDSTYMFDFEYAKEAEGKIKFRDPKTEKVGFFDIDGNIIIPAQYNDARDFSNGLAIVIKNAHKKHWNEDKEHNDGCDHWSWNGGKTYAINSEGKELFEIPKIENNLFSIDYSKVKINENVDSEIFTSYKGIDGNIYSFSSPEKDFKKWFETIFLADFRKNKTIRPEFFYDLISVADNNNPNEQTAWKNHKKSEYLKTKIKHLNTIINNVVNDKLEMISYWDTLSNHSYFPINETPKDDLSSNTVLSVSFRKKNDFSTDSDFQFTKIGQSFYITSAP